MADKKAAFSPPSEEQIISAGAQPRKVTVAAYDGMYTFEAESLSDAIAASEALRRLLKPMRDLEEREVAEADEPVVGVGHVGPHGEGCRCDEILGSLLGRDVAKQILDRIRKAQEKGH